MTNGETPQPISDEEARRLVPHIERIARQVANQLNASRWVRDALAQDAVGHVFTVYHKFDPAIASFGTWCHTVLRNKCVSLIRKDAGRRRAMGGLHDEASIAEERQRREGPVSSADEPLVERPLPFLLARFEMYLVPLDRLLLGAYQGLLSRFGVEVVHRWCRADKRDGDAAFLEIETMPQNKRKQALAQLFGETSDWVRQRIFRAVEKLRRGLEEEGEL